MMPSALRPSLAHYVQAFFDCYLRAQRDLSPHTVLSYRDAIKLFLIFAARHRHREVVDLCFEDVSPDVVLAFLEHLEKERGNSARTRNVRLAALHTFYRYVGAHEPQVLDLCQRVNAIPVKKSKVSTVTYLEYDEVLHVLNAIDRSTSLGQRDYLLIRMLFETGVRADEIAQSRTSALRLFSPHQIVILGKGSKERICPLRAPTAKLIRDHLTARGLTPEQDSPLFVGIRGAPLTRFGVLRLVQRRARRAAKTMPKLASKRIGAHTLRHSAAVYMLRSGNALPVIRSWLGHVSVATTDQYTDIDLEMKREALEACEPIPTPPRHPAWRRDPNLLAWLESL